MVFADKVGGEYVSSCRYNIKICRILQFKRLELHCVGLNGII